MKYLTAMVLMALTAAACGDVLTLDDGSKVEGKAKKVGDQWVVTDAAGHETTVDPGRIVSFHLTGSAPATVAAVDRLSALRTSVSNLSDIQVIIDRYTQFIKQSAGSPQAQEAASDLTVWRKRLSESDRKVGDRWLTPLEWQTLASDEANDAVTIGAMVKRGDADAANEQIKQALTDDPDNPSALYLRGYLSYKNDQIVPARADFEHVLKTVTDDAPTLNNLAVTLYRQRNYGAALNNYLKAMAGAPVDQAILDNVAETLHGLPAEMTSGDLAKKVQAMFEDQDKQLQALKQAKGLYRWGSDWYPAEKVAQLNAEKQDHEKILETLQAQEQETAESLANTETQLQGASHYVVTPPMMTSHQQYVSDADMGAYRQQTANLTEMQHIEIGKLDNLRKQIQNLQNRMSRAEFSGVQRMIGPEGMPTRLPPTAAPTTKPDGNGGAR